MDTLLRVSDRRIRRLLYGAVALIVLFQCDCGSKPFRFLVAFKEATGLKTGSEVRYLGLKVGTVEKVFIQQREGGNKPEVSVAVALQDRKIQIRRDDRFGISSAGFLGEEFLNVTPGAASSTAIPEGSTVHGEISSLDIVKIPILGDAYHLASRLSSLPKDKREDLLKRFDKLIDDASGEPPVRPKSENPKKP